MPLPRAPFGFFQPHLSPVPQNHRREVTGQGWASAPRVQAPESEPGRGVPLFQSLSISEPLCCHRPPGGANRPGTGFGAGSGKASLC